MDVSHSRPKHGEHDAQAAEKAPRPFAIPSEARNLSFFFLAWTEERLLASLGMAK
jgi:hypothetical protein